MDQQRLVTITSGERQADGAVIFDIVADLGGGEASYQFVYRDSDTHGLSPQVKAYLVVHPDVPITDAQP